MEIGPIPGLRAVPTVQTNRAASDLSAVFRVEFQREPEQDTYAPHHESERGLEGEEDETGEQEESGDAEPARVAHPQGDGTINFFA